MAVPGHEVLLFAGLFCAYTVYRGLHPEVFEYASLFLDTKLGALNTVVLLISSFTAAWAVTATQLNQKKIAAGCLVVTFVCAGAFMGVKYIEYTHKFHEGLMWGLEYNPKHDPPPPHIELAGAEATGSEATPVVRWNPGDDSALIQANQSAIPAPARRRADSPLPSRGAGRRRRQRPRRRPQRSKRERLSKEDIRNIHIFFGIYFCMTGLHGIHVLIGMLAILWVLVRTLRGDFSKEYWLPVDLVALYWHIVDLIWIFLFPLLYLIG